MVEHLEAWYEDPRIWVALSFVLFMGIFVKYVLPFIVKALDGRAEKIRTQLEQASRLRAEAEALLAEYTAAQEAAVKETAAMIAQATLDADALRAKATKDLEQSIARRRQQATDSIARAEEDAIRQIRDQVIQLATETARSVMLAHLKDQGEDPTIAQAIHLIERKIH